MSFGLRTRCLELYEWLQDKIFQTSFFKFHFITTYYPMHPSHRSIYPEKIGKSQSRRRVRSFPICLYQPRRVLCLGNPDKYGAHRRIFVCALQLAGLVLAATIPRIVSQIQSHDCNLVKPIDGTNSRPLPYLAQPLVQPTTR